MQDAAPSCCHREVQDLYHAWLLANDAADSDLDRHSCRDKNLLAIAQLAAIKVRTQRAIISLIDGESQHIVAEASNTLSPFLNPSSANHELLSGVNSQPLSNAFTSSKYSRRAHRIRNRVVYLNPTISSAPIVGLMAASRTIRS